MECPIDLDALDDYLMSDHAPDDSMGLLDLDGFLTGVVVGPELILASLEAERRAWATVYKENRRREEEWQRTRQTTKPRTVTKGR